MLERELVAKIKKWINDNGAFCFKTHGGMYQQPGLSDIIGLKDGRFFAFEVKLPGKEKTLTPLQTKFLDTVAGHGGMASMVTSLDDVKEALSD